MGTPPRSRSRPARPPNSASSWACATLSPPCSRPKVQRAFHERAFNPCRWQVITAGRADIGILDVDYRPGEIYLSRIEIGPGHQGRGIGSRIIRALLEEAQRKGQDLVLDVLTVNRRARALYERLGLAEAARHGDRGAKVTMRSARRRT